MSANLLRNRDYIIIVSRCAASRDKKHPWYGDWIEAQASLIDLAKKCNEFDRDGLTLYETSNPIRKYEYTNVVKLAEILQQQNQPPTSELPEKSNLYEALNNALSEYFQRKTKGTAQKSGLIIVVFIDQKQDEIAPMSNLIIEASNQLDRDEEMGITFIQMGDEAITREFLTLLDDDLRSRGAKFDIVDTKYWHEISRKSITEFLTEAIHD